MENSDIIKYLSEEDKIKILTEVNGKLKSSIDHYKVDS